MEKPSGFTLFLAVLGLMTVGTVLWYALPVRDWLDRDRLQWLAVMLRMDPNAILYVVLAYLVGGIVSFPIFILIPLTAMVFGVLPGACYAAAGLMANALLLYCIGHFLGHDAVQRLAGSRMHRVSLYLARQGLLTIALLRFLPIAPYTIVNLAAGASHIRLREYALGTMLGISPAIFIMSFVGNELNRANAWFLSKSIVISAALACFLYGTVRLMRVWSSIRSGKRP